MAAQTRSFIILGIAAVAGLVIGILIGYYGIHKHPVVEEKLGDLEARSITREDDDMKSILNDVNLMNIKEHIKNMSKTPHMAGSERDNEMARQIRDMWIQQGLFDDVKLVPYDVLLSYPNETNPNKVQIVDRDTVVFESRDYEIIPNNDEKMIPAFHGYAPSGIVEGDPVYVNYGRVEDFEKLRELGVDVARKICIARYGKIFRGNKVAIAQKNGAAGVVMYLDPIDVARQGTEPENVYPNTFWMPGSAIQRGSVMVGSGDPLTPNYPSIDGAYRYDVSEVGLPVIPSQPIGYDDARKILEIMDGRSDLPEDWRGGLNITYRLGPRFNSENRYKRLRIIVNNRYEQVTSYNVIGTVIGSQEPDRYVLVGSHRDAWGFGAIDPVSSTSQLLEATRVLGNIRRNGWSPRRTLVFCSWGAEEYGIIGSTEWVEENIHVLMDRAVAYVNIDSCVSGTAFQLTASPILADFSLDVTKNVADPENPNQSVYQTWKNYTTDGKNDADPVVETLGSGTDHAPFSFYAGVPAINFWWKIDKKKFQTSTYPAYHTAFETFYLMDKFVDPKYTYHQACSRMTGLFAYKLSNVDLLPYNMAALADRLKMALADVMSKHNMTFKENNLSLDHLKDAITNFKEEAVRWHDDLNRVNKSDPIKLRMVNDQMMMLERVFIKADGLPGRASTRHVAFAPSAVDQYASAGFPAIADLMNGIDSLDGSEASKRWQKLRRHVSDLMIIVRMAATFLKENPFV